MAHNKNREQNREARALIKTMFRNGVTDFDIISKEVFNSVQMPVFRAKIITKSCLEGLKNQLGLN